MKKWKVVFAGTPEIAVPVLMALAADTRFEVVAVATQPDRPVGRKQLLTAPPVKAEAEKLGIPVWQESAKSPEFLMKLREVKPDFLVVIAYGQILPQEVLNVPKIAPINLHGSLLPKYRGASPIQAALLAGEKQTGISVMRMMREMDAGPVYGMARLPLTEDDTAETVIERMGKVGAEILPDTLERIASGVLRPMAQIKENATYCGKIEREDGEIHPESETVEEVFRKYQAFTPWPGVFLFVNGKRVKLLKIAPCRDQNFLIPTIGLHTIEKRLFLGCKSGVLEVLELQMEGKNPISGAQWVN